MVYMTCEL